MGVGDVCKMSEGAVAVTVTVVVAVSVDKSSVAIALSNVAVISRRRRRLHLRDDIEKLLRYTGTVRGTFNSRLEQTWIQDIFRIWVLSLRTIDLLNNITIKM